METNIFVNWSDGLGGGRAFDHHRRNEWRAFANKSRSGHSVTIFSNARGLPEGGGGCSRLKLTRTLPLSKPPYLTYFGHVTGHVQ